MILSVRKLPTLFLAWLLQLSKLSWLFLTIWQDIVVGWRKWFGRKKSLTACLLTVVLKCGSERKKISGTVKITKTWIQIFRLNWFGIFSNISHQMLFWIIPIVSWSKSNRYKHQKIKKYALNLQLQTIQILTNDVQTRCSFCVFLILLVCNSNRLWHYRM